MKPCDGCGQITLACACGVTPRHRPTATEWFKKRADPEALYAARVMSCLLMFEAISPVVHRDDIPKVAALLDVGPDAMLLLFEPTTLEECAP